MRKVIIMISLFAFFQNVFCPEPTLSNEINIIDPDKVIKFDPILDAFEFRESSKRQFAYNEAENACGILQIRQSMIDEANRISGYEKYNLIDAWDVKKSEEIWYVVMKVRNPEYSIKKAVEIWQGKFVQSYYEQIVKTLR